MSYRETPATRFIRTPFVEPSRVFLGNDEEGDSADRDSAVYFLLSPLGTKRHVIGATRCYRVSCPGFFTLNPQEFPCNGWRCWGEGISTSWKLYWASDALGYIAIAGHGWGYVPDAGADSWFSADFEAPDGIVFAPQGVPAIWTPPDPVTGSIVWLYWELASFIGGNGWGRYVAGRYSTATARERYFGCPSWSFDGCVIWRGAHPDADGIWSFADVGHPHHVPKWDGDIGLYVIGTVGSDEWYTSPGPPSGQAGWTWTRHTAGGDEDVTLPFSSWGQGYDGFETYAFQPAILH